MSCRVTTLDSWTAADSLRQRDHEKESAVEEPA